MGFKDGVESGRVKEIDLPAGLMTRTNLSHTNNASDITL